MAGPGRFWTTVSSSSCPLKVPRTRYVVSLHAASGFSRAKGDFDEDTESEFLAELETSLSMIDAEYEKMLQGGQAALSKAWRFSRRARGKFFELLAEHDKLTHFILAKTWSPNHLNALPFFTGAGVCDLLRSVDGATSRTRKPIVQDSFVRASYKFVMKSEDVVDFMVELMPHLPLYVFKKDGDVIASTHSIYMDGADLPLYHKKASNERDGAVLLRLRWYDVDDPDHFYAETKVSKDKVTRVPAKKTRARIEKSSLQDLLQGRGVTGGVLRAFQEKVLGLHARPVLRTTARRVCFQVPDDPSLRITIDLDFEAVLEDRHAWAFQEKGSPYVHFTRKEAVQYPLAIVEVKVASSDPEPPMPKWLEAMVKRHSMVEAKISKYLFAVASLLPNEIAYVPDWFHNSLRLQTEVASPAPAVRIDPRTIIKTENLTLKWFALATIPLGSVIVSNRPVSKTLHLVSLACSILIIAYATRLYFLRVEQLAKGDALLPDRQGIVLAAACISAYGILYTLMIDFELNEPA